MNTPIHSVLDQTPPAPWQRLIRLAERHPALAERFIRRAIAEEAAGPSWGRFACGWLLLFWERFDEARDELRAARREFEAAGLELAALRCTFGLQLADLTQSMAFELVEDLDETARLFERHGAPAESARARLHQALLLANLGWLDQAEQLVAELRQPLAASGAEPLDHARLLIIAGGIANSRSNYGAAMQALAEAEQILRRERGLVDLARCRFQQGWTELRRENLNAGLEHYRAAERLFLQIGLPLRLALCHRAIGLVLSRQGDYAGALRMQLDAADRFQKLGRTLDIGHCLLNLGNIYFYGGQWEPALTFYRRAEDCYEQIQSPAWQIECMRNSALVYQAQGRLSEAHRMLDRVEVMARETNPAELAEAQSVRAGLYATEGDIPKAIRRYQEAQRLFLDLGSALDAAECLVEQGWLALHTGDTPTAQDCFDAAAPEVEPQPYYRWRTEHGLARCAEAAGDEVRALKHYRDAILTVADLRGNLAHEQFSSGIYDQAATLYEDALRLAVAQGLADDVIVLGEYQRALALQRARAAALPDPSVTPQEAIEHARGQLSALLDEAQINRDPQAYIGMLLRAAGTEGDSRTGELASFNLAMLRAQLDEVFDREWTALIYLISDGQLLISTLTSEGTALATAALDRHLRELIADAGDPEKARFVYNDLPYHYGQADEPWQDLRAMAARLLPPEVMARLHPQHRLLIVPSGILHSLPWGLLRLEQGWLLEQATVQVLPSLAVWQALATTPKRAGGRALLVGCSEFDERAPQLPAVGDEIASVQRHWSDADTLLDGNATRASVLERLVPGRASYRLIHLATHAQLLPTQSSQAHILLHDGELRLEDLIGLRLDGALVVLSACHGASAEVLPGEELISLSWALLAAGASGLLATLWPVEDEGTRPFMERFYHNLGQTGDPCAALAQTQRDAAGDGAFGAALGGPANWGCFVFTGGEAATPPAS
ncbi:MAG TPA: CHAT domain-containing protein [Roseiflexaceae bacterium]|nr:CHAT domain-containing protein [Roseiflexaceae bacterium]